MTFNGESEDRINTLKRLAVFVGAVACGAALYASLGDRLRLDYLSTQEAELRALQATNPWRVYGLAFAVYVAVTGLSLPGAAVLSLAYGWYFGFIPGVILVSISSTTGATLAFLLSRYLFRDAIAHRFGDRLKHFNESLEREGPFFLFMLRLIPVVPFFVINAVMGITPISVRNFWWISQIGMLPGTLVYLYAGSRVPSLEALASEGARAVFTPRQLTELAVAFGVLGAFPFLVRAATARFRNSTNSPPESPPR